MKDRHHLHGRRGVSAVETAPSYHAESSPNSSVVLTVTVLADVEDVLAVIRTAVLLGGSFRASTSIDLFGAEPVRIDCDENEARSSLKSALDSIEGKLLGHAASHEQAFAIEATITAASFLTAGSIAVHIRSADSLAAGPTIAR